MSFSTYLTDKLNLTKESVLGLQSLKEYTTHLIANFEELVSGTFVGTVSIPLPVTDTTEKLFAINADQVQTCINESAETVTLQLNGNGDTMTFETSVVNEALENLLSEARVQKEFLDAMLESVSITAATFATTVLTKYQTISTDLVEKYSQYLDAGDKLTALRQWINEKNQATISTSNNQVTLFKRGDYVGESVWLIVLTDFTNAVSDAFNLVVESVNDLLHVFEKIWEGIKNLGSWILRKAVLPLTTNFCEGDARIGIIDMPIFQIELGTAIIPGSSCSINIQFDTLLRQVLLKVGGDYKLVNPYWPSNNDTYQSTDYYDRYKDLLTAVVNGNLIGGSSYGVPYRPIDILWTSQDNPDNNLIFRLGPIKQPDSTYKIYLQCFYACPSNFYGLYTDRQIYQKIKNAWYDYLVEMFDNFTYNHIPSQGNGTAFNAVRNQVITDLSSSESSSDGPLNLVQHMAYYSTDEVYNNTNKTNAGDALNYGQYFAAFIWYVVLPWIYINGRSGDDITVSNGYLSVDDCTLLGRYSTYWVGWESHAIDNTAPTDWNLIYRPYVRDGLYGVSLHCQTLREQATELERYIMAAIIAVAAVFITVKFHSVIKTVHAKAKLARGAADDYSWKHGVNPSSQDVAEYKRLNRVANRWERFESLTGKLSPVKMLQSIKDRALDNNESLGKSIDDVYNVIRGV